MGGRGDSIRTSPQWTRVRFPEGSVRSPFLAVILTLIGLIINLLQLKAIKVSLPW